MLKSSIKKLFAIVGLQVRRIPSVPSPTPPTPSVGHLRFGSYTIETDNVELMRSYRDYPETNTAIGRLVSLLAKNGSMAMIDIGANCGDSLAIAKQASPNSEVLCIEGDKQLHSTLTLNSKQFSGVTIKNCYLGENKTQITVAMDKRGYNNTLIHGNAGCEETEEISIETLDDVVSSWQGLSRLRFIKCDTEGYDVKVLLGGISTLKAYQPVLFFEYNREAMKSNGESGFRIFSRLAEAGYRYAGFYDAFGRFILELDLANMRQIEDLHEYADGKYGKVYYYDVAVFSMKDDALAAEFFREERRRRDRLGIA
jgi:FkbM family methyltransferase